MPTLEDLRAAFTELERQAPAELSHPARLPHRRRWATIGLAAACTAALAVALPLAVGSGSGRPAGHGSSGPIRLPGVLAYGFTHALPAPAAGHSPDLAYAFVVPQPVAGYTVIPDEITTSYQHATIYGQTDPPGGDVYLFYRGAFDPAAIRDKDAHGVAGNHTGYFGRVAIAGAGVLTGLAWEYADGGWAFVHVGLPTGASLQHDRAAERRAAAARTQQLSTLVRHYELELADDVLPADDQISTPAAVPVAPGRYVTELTTANDHIGSLTLADAGTTTWQISWQPTDAVDHAWVVSGDQAVLTTGELRIAVSVSSTTGSASGTQPLLHFVRSLRIASDPADPDTWFSANAALP